MPSNERPCLSYCIDPLCIILEQGKMYSSEITGFNASMVGTNLKQPVPSVKSGSTIWSLWHPCVSTFGWLVACLWPLKKFSPISKITSDLQNSKKKL